ncbi:MAG: c-type cytochrome [Rhodanobacteraceae bacterium]
MRVIYALIFWIVIAIIAYFVVAFTGAYQVGADVAHWGVTSRAIGFLREHTVDRRSADIRVPPLEDAAMVRQGAQLYARSCAGCHVAPGRSPSPVHEDMYPQPPNLTRFAPRPAEAFWIIKHGFKMTGMPAWGRTLDDQKIWTLVAYLQKQPRMSADEFRELTAQPAPASAPASPSTVATPVPSASGAAAPMSVRR